MKYIKVMTVPGETVDLELENDATIGDAVNKAGMSMSGYSCTVNNGQQGAAGTVIKDGGIICLTRQVKGA